MSRTSDTAYDLDEDSYWHSPKTIAAGLVLLAVVGAAVWVTASGGEDPAAAPSTAAAAQQPAAGNPPPAPAGGPLPVGSTYNSACGLSGGSTQVPTTTPAGTEWRNLDGWYLPLNKQHGPGKRSETGPWSCFAQTPTGAVLAAHTIQVNLARAADFEAVLKRQTVPGVARSKRLDEGQGKAATGPHPVPLGFVVESYTRDDATITFYLRDAGAGEYSCSVHAQWAGGATGDWRIRLEPDGGISAGCIQGAPSRYVPWGPANV